MTKFKILDLVREGLRVLDDSEVSPTDALAEIARKLGLDPDEVSNAEVVEALARVLGDDAGGEGDGQAPEGRFMLDVGSALASAVGRANGREDDFSRRAAGKVVDLVRVAKSNALIADLSRAKRFGHLAVKRVLAAHGRVS